MSTEHIRRPILPTDYLPLDTALVSDIYRYAGLYYGERAFASILHDDTSILEEVTWGRLLRDSERVASWLRQEAPGLSTSATVALLGTSGYTYYTHIVAILLNGWAPLVLSTRNSVPANSHLLKTVKAAILLHDAAFAASAGTVKDDTPTVKLVSFVPNDFFVEDIVPPASDSLTVAKLLDSAAIYTHTSGSTGHPKPVAMSHRHFIERVKMRSAQRYVGSQAYAPFPTFHGLGIYCFCQWPLGSGVIPTFVDMRTPLTGEAVVRHLPTLIEPLAILPPSVLEEITALDAPSVHVLTRACRVLYAGAPLREEAGNFLVRRGVPLSATYGMSEIGLVSVLTCPTHDPVKDWEYVRLREDGYTMNMVPRAGTELRHLVVSPGAIITPAVINNDDPVGYATNDLWQRHPVYPDVWKHSGRGDSVTVLSNGEKTDDEQLCKLLLQDAKIARVVVFGTGKMYNGVLLQPTPAYADAKNFVDMIWLTVENANAIIPKHSRLMRNMVIVADPYKPFVTTDKGTTRKKDTLTLYESEIDTAYEKQDSGDFGEDRSATASAPELRARLRGVVLRALGKEVSDDDDLFDLGFDSLHAFELRSAIVAAIRGTGKSSVLVPANIVYTYPTVSKLADYIISGRLGSAALNVQSNRARINECIERFSSGFQQRVSSKETPEPTENLTVVITGTTGSLGSHALVRLLASPNVRKVYCLLRGTDLPGKQAEALDTRGIDSAVLASHSDKLELCGCDMSKPDLGLREDVIQQIREKATHIVHLAWHLNFNWDLARFEKTHIAGVRGIIDLALSSQRPLPPRVVFMSSIGAVLNASSDAPIAEELYDDPNVASGTGYGEAKFVAEQVLHRATKVGLKATVIRSGQLSGSTANGSWSSNEYIPVLIKSSLALGVAPESLPPLHWLPVDVAADATLSLSLRPDANLAVYHLENPASVSWSTVLNTLATETQTALKLVSNDQWLRTVEQSSGGAKKIPAVALLQFYANFFQSIEGWVVLDTRKAVAVVASLGMINEEVLAKYGQWIANH